MKNDSWTGDINGETWPDRVDRIVFRTSPTRTRRTTRSRPARPTSPTSRRPGPTRPVRTGARRSTSRSSARTTTTSTIGIPASVGPRTSTAAPGDLEGHRPRGDQRVRLQRAAHDRRPASRLPASPASPRTCASTARTTRRRPRRRSTSGWRRATSRSRSRSSSTPTPVTRRRGHHRRQPGGDRDRGRGRPAASRRRTSPRCPTGGCVFCRTGWFTDYPTYDNFMYDLFHTDPSAATTTATATPSSTRSSTRPSRPSTRTRGRAVPAGRADPPQRQTSAVPINWYLGDYAYDQEKIRNFAQTDFGLITTGSRSRWPADAITMRPAVGPRRPHRSAAETEVDPCSATSSADCC